MAVQLVQHMVLVDKAEDVRFIFWSTILLFPGFIVIFIGTYNHIVFYCIIIIYLIEFILKD